MKEGLALLPGVDGVATTRHTMITLGDVKEVDALTTSVGMQAAILAISGGDDAEHQAALRKAQHAIILRPGDVKNWETLAFVRSQHLKRDVL